MRVMCIDGVKSGAIASNSDVTGKENEIYEGEVYTVDSEFEKEGMKFYFLHERPERFGYRVERFVPLSPDSEAEVVNEMEELVTN